MRGKAAACLSIPMRHTPQKERPCLPPGLSEVIHTANRMQLQAHAEALVQAILQAICDEEEEIQEAAAYTFDQFFKVCLPWRRRCNATDSVMPFLQNKCVMDVFVWRDFIFVIVLPPDDLNVETCEFDARNFWGRVQVLKERNCRHPFPPPFPPFGVL